MSSDYRKDSDFYLYCLPQGSTFLLIYKGKRCFVILFFEGGIPECVGQNFALAGHFLIFINVLKFGALSFTEGLNFQFCESGSWVCLRLAAGRSVPISELQFHDS
jgi:hypothetical protein